MKPGIEIEGLEGTLAALREFEPEILKSMNKELRSIGQELKTAAVANYALTGGSGGYTLRSRSRGKSVGMGVVAKGSTGTSGSDWSRSGILSAILELYGKKGTSTTRSSSCLATLNERYGLPGRFLWSAWSTQRASAIPRVEAAVRRAEEQLQKTLDEQGIGY